MRCRVRSALWSYQFVESLSGSEGEWVVVLHGDFVGAEVVEGVVAVVGAALQPTVFLSGEPGVLVGVDVIDVASRKPT